MDLYGGIYGSRLAGLYGMDFCNFGGFSNIYQAFASMLKFSNVFGTSNYNSSYAQNTSSVPGGVNNSAAYSESGFNSFVPNLRVGEKGYGTDEAWSESVSYSNNQNAPGSNYNMAKAGTYERKLYEYDRIKAVDYQFQQGQIIQNKDVQSETETKFYDPIIIDLDGNGQLDVTGRDDSEVNKNYKTKTSTTEANNRATTAEERKSTGKARAKDVTTTTATTWDTYKDWNNKIDYDIDGDGKKERTEWLKKGTNDGILVYDNNKDGKITGNELTNEHTIDGKTHAYKSGWEKAKALGDKDNDGILRGNELNGFSVWVDKNGDGVTDKGELKSTNELGLYEINCNSGEVGRRKEIASEKGSYANVYSGSYDSFGNNYGMTNTYMSEASWMVAGGMTGNTEVSTTKQPERPAAPAVSSTQQTSGTKGKLEIRDGTIYTPGGYKITYEATGTDGTAKDVCIKGMSEEGNTGKTTIWSNQTNAPVNVDSSSVPRWSSKNNSTSFNLPDGTKITVNAGGSMKSVDVYYGNDHIHADANGKFTGNSNDGYRADAMQDDGTSVYAKGNDAGKWYKTDGNQVSYRGV